MPDMLLPVRVLTLFSCVLLCCCPLRAEDEAARKTFSAITSQARLLRLSNGLRVVLYRRGIAPVFAGAVVVRVGGTDEPFGKSGIAHMLEHMAFKGTDQVGTIDYAHERKLLDELEVLARAQALRGSLDSAQQSRWDQIQSELRKLWITEAFTREFNVHGAVGMNATTDTELTRYFVNLPRSAFEFWCAMESGRLLRPVMRQFYQERDVVLEERRMRYDDDPSGKLYELLLGTVFRTHPYRNPVIGYRFDVQRLTASDVEEFRRQYYVPSNIVIGLVGDVQPEQDQELLERYFGRLPTADSPTRPHAVEPEQQGERTAVLEERAAPELAVAYRKVQYPHPDDPALSLMLEILAGGKTSPLFVDLVKTRRLATAISYDEGPGIAYPNFMAFFITPRAPHSTREALKAFDNVLQTFRAKGPSAEDLLIAKRATAVEYLNGFKSNLSLALNFATSEVVYNDWKAAFDWYEKAMTVKESDIQRVARQYLVSEKRSVLQLEKKIETANE